MHQDLLPLRVTEICLSNYFLFFIRVNPRNLRKEK